MILEYSFKIIFNALHEEAKDEEGVNNSSQKKINHEMIPDARLLHIFLIYLHIQNQGDFKASVIQSLKPNWGWELYQKNYRKLT